MVAVLVTVAVITTEELEEERSASATCRTLWDGKVFDSVTVNVVVPEIRELRIADELDVELDVAEDEERDEDSNTELELDGLVTILWALLLLMST